MADQPVTIEKLINADIDVDNLGKAANELGIVNPRYGSPYKTAPQAIQDLQQKADQVVAQGFYRGYTTEALLLADKPVVAEMRARADDTRKIYRWTRTSAEGDSLVTGNWIDTGLSDLELSKQYIDAKILHKLQSFGAEVLTQVGLPTISSSYYSSSSLIPVQPHQTLKATTQLYGIDNVFYFYGIRKQYLGTEEKSPVAYNGVIDKSAKVPDGAYFVRLGSANSTRPTYIPYDFKLEILDENPSLISSELVVDYEKLHSEGQNGSSSDAGSLYKSMIIPVTSGQTITYNELRTSGVPPIIVYGSSGEEIERHSEQSKTFVLPNGARSVLIQAYSKAHVNYASTWASKTYVRRGYVDQLESSEMKTKLVQISNDLQLMKIGGAVIAKDSDFTVLEASSNYDRTQKIKTLGLTKLYLRGLIQNGNSVPSSIAVVRGYLNNGSIINLVTTNSVGLNRFNAIYSIPSNVEFVDVYLMNKTHALYNPEYERLVILAGSNEEIYSTIKETTSDVLKYNFPIKDTHAFTSSNTYDSVRIPVFPSMVLKYSVASLGGAGQADYNDGSSERVDGSEKTIEFNKFGYFTLSTFNSKHASYNPNFTPYYQLLKNLGEEGAANLDGFVTGEYLPTPTLKAVREITFSDGSQKTAVQYLWQDRDDNFFISSTLRGDKKFIFKFDSRNFYDGQPHHFSMGFDKYGNIVCIFRIEQLDMLAHSDSLRKNPIILVKKDGYKPKVVDMGVGLKPSGWLQNCGFLCTDEYIMLTEYTRPSVATANTWKATYPLTDAANWKVVQSFELSPEVNPLDNMKHIHNVDRDPFTGYIYTSTGDNNSGAAMFMSKDNGDTFIEILSGSEKYCRVLNWVFTKDWIYWATDSLGSYHWFFKAPRNSLGEFDTNNIVDILQFPNESWATYATIYMPKINALVFLGRADSASTELPIDVYDLKKDQFIKLDTLSPVGNVASDFGFRCECFEWIPRGNEIACGFSRILGPGGYENKIGILGNTANVAKKVNNLVLTIDRVGDDFTISYDTVVL